MKDMMGQYGYSGMSSIIKSNIQDSSDDDIIFSKGKETKQSVNYDRFATFSFELVFINRIIMVREP